MKVSWGFISGCQLFIDLYILTVITFYTIDKLHFIKGTEYQLSPEYTMNVYKLMSKMSLHDAIKW